MAEQKAPRATSHKVHDQPAPEPDKDNEFDEDNA
jgi:hypothetical protein